MYTMKDIHWNKLSVFEQVIFILGWFSIFNILFWITFVIVYAIGRNRRGKEFKQFFNPHTFKVPYVFGWINAILVVFMVLVMILMMGLGFFVLPRMFMFHFW